MGIAFLTRRQQIVLELYEQGLRQHEIAKRLGLNSQGTVANYIYLIKEKALKANDRELIHRIQVCKDTTRWINPEWVKNRSYNWEEVEKKLKLNQKNGKNKNNIING